MARTLIKTATIAVDQNPASLSKAQQAFNKLIKQIEARRTQLAAWDIAAPPYQRKYTSEMLPLLETAISLQIEMLQVLDQASDKKGLTNKERHLLSDFIAEMAGELLETRDDAELKSIYNKHSRSDFDSEEAGKVELMKSVLENTFGLDIDDKLDFDSPEDLLRHAQEQFYQKQARVEAEREAQQTSAGQRKKSNKQAAKEAKREADAQQVSQSVREVYRKLASALHPDREPDPQERERKTALMQRANQAYSKGNLLQLLELQLELEHIDQTAINNISEDRLKHYNKVLKEQLAELDQEILAAEADFKARFNIHPYEPISPSTAPHQLSGRIVDLKRGIRDIKQDLVALGDIRNIKMWLKSIRRQPRIGEIDDLLN